MYGNTATFTVTTPRQGSREDYYTNCDTLLSPRNTDTGKHFGRNVQNGTAFFLSYKGFPTTLFYDTAVLSYLLFLFF